MRKAIAVVLMALAAAAGIFAGIPGLTLTNVGFNGTIETVGKENAPAPVRILDSPQGSSYTLKGAYISTLELSGKGTVILENCTVGGAVTITGPASGGSLTVQFKKTGTGTSTISGNIEVSGNASLSLTDTALNSNVTGLDGFKGSFSMSGGSFGNTPSLLFGDRELSSFSVSGTTGNIGTIDLRDCGLASGFTLNPTSGTIKALDVSKNANANVVNEVNLRKNSWSFDSPASLVLSEIGLQNSDTIATMLWFASINGWAISNSTVRKLDISGNPGISYLSVNRNHQNANMLRELYASHCSLSTAVIWMGADGGIMNDSVLDLSYNHLGYESSDMIEYVVRQTTGTSDDEMPSDTNGSSIETEYHRYSLISATERHGYDEDDDEYTYTEYRYTDTTFIKAYRTSSLNINGHAITTWFRIGDNITSDWCTGLVDYNSSATVRVTNGDKGNLHYSSSKTKSPAFRFDSEWSSLDNIRHLDLRGNNIQYRVGFVKMKGEWGKDIFFYVRTGTFSDSDRLAMVTPDDGDSTSAPTHKWFGFASSGSFGTWNYYYNWPDTGQTETVSYYNGSASVAGRGVFYAPQNGTAIFGLRREKEDTAGANTKSVRGVDMWVWPFGQ